VATDIQFEPTSAARNLFWDPEQNNESSKAYHEMWEDLNRCANFSASITTSQRHSLYMQMACHAKWGLNKLFGGNTWDLEAWRAEIDWSEALSYGRKCQNYGNVDASAYIKSIDGRIVQSSLDLEPHLASWLVAGRERRPIEKIEGYFCLINLHGKAPGVLFAGGFLNDYLGGKPGTTVTNEEACSQPQPKPGTVPPPPPPKPEPTPPPPPQSRGYYIEDSVLGGTWARTDPNNGTWYSQANKPANGAYWYPNGLGVAVDCARAAAGYVVKWADGHTENWNTWFHVTDGKWYPSAATREISSNGLQGLRAC
jgi:hypothetical protein